MNIIFGTDGWRGLLDSDMNEQNVSLVAQAFADYAKEVNPSPAVAIGYDGRRRSQEFANLFTSILIGNSITCFLSDRIIPTPVVSYFVKANRLDFGVMVTASHNPPEYNGIKFKAAYGGPFFTEETHKVEKLIGRSPITESTIAINTHDLISSYVRHLYDIIDFPKISNSEISVIIDSMSGAGGTMLEELLSSNGITAKTIFGIPDEQFSGRLAEPIEKNLIPLRDELRKKKCSLGVATDGDADRLGILLDTGEWLSSQETILLLADFIKNSKNISGDIIKTSSVTNLIDVNLSSSECTVHDVQVGFKYICETMLKTNASFGAEESGGYGFKGHIPERDGIVSALLFIEMLASSPYKTLTEFVYNKRKQFGMIYYDRIDHPYHDNDRNDKLPILEKAPPAIIAHFTVNKMDKYFSSRGIINGLKFTLEGKSRWLLLRSSETELLIRIYAEGESNNEVQQILNSGIALITT